MLKIITKRSISHHFKIRQMRNVTYFININSSHTSLDIEHPLASCRMLFSHEIRDKRLHTSSIKHRCRIISIIYNQWCRLTQYMVLWYSKIWSEFSKVVAFHRNMYGKSNRNIMVSNNVATIELVKNKLYYLLYY